MGGMTTVACKIPNGIMIYGYHKRKQKVPAGPGNMMVEEEMYVRDGREAKLAGPGAPTGQMPRAPVTAGGAFALTQVDADLWEEWLAWNRDSDVIKNKLVFASESLSDVKAEAREMRGERTGLEPIDVTRTVLPDGRVQLKDRRIPRSMNPNVAQVVDDKNPSSEMGD